MIRRFFSSAVVRSRRPRISASSSGSAWNGSVLGSPLFVSSMRIVAVALKGSQVGVYSLPLLHVNPADTPQEGSGFVLAVERGECSDDDATALDEPRDGPVKHGGEAPGAVGDEGDFVGHGRAA